MNAHQKISAKGGRSGRGAVKARTSEQASAAAQAMHAKRRAKSEADAPKTESQGEARPCPNCYGGHYRPCQWCGDSGTVTFFANT